MNPQSDNYACLRGWVDPSATNKFGVLIPNPTAQDAGEALLQQRLLFKLFALQTRGARIGPSPHGHVATYGLGPIRRPRPWGRVMPPPSRAQRPPRLANGSEPRFDSKPRYIFRGLDRRCQKSPADLRVSLASTLDLRMSVGRQPPVGHEGGGYSTSLETGSRDPASAGHA